MLRQRFEPNTRRKPKRRGFKAGLQESRRSRQMKVISDRLIESQEPKRRHNRNDETSNPPDELSESDYDATE